MGLWSIVTGFLGKGAVPRAAPSPFEGALSSKMSKELQTFLLELQATIVRWNNTTERVRVSLDKISVDDLYKLPEDRYKHQNATHFVADVDAAIFSPWQRWFAEVEILRRKHQLLWVKYNFDTKSFQEGIKKIKLVLPAEVLEEAKKLDISKSKQHLRTIVYPKLKTITEVASNHLQSKLTALQWEGSKSLGRAAA